jgi:hypothetical protein
MGKPWADHGQSPSRQHCPADKALLPQVFSGADDGIRTRDPHLGKVMLYQLSHVRVGTQEYQPGSGDRTGWTARVTPSTNRR